MKGAIMKDENNDVGVDSMKESYDFDSMAGGVQGKYADRYKAGTNLVHLEPDVAAVFKDESSVNRALRAIIHAARNSIPSSE